MPAVTSRFLRACRGEPTDCTPVWCMRQAGRYLPEYRALRERYGFLEMCKTPEVAAEVTLLPLARFPLDAAILFADILLVLEPMGVGLEFSRGDGPVIHRPVRSRRDIEALAAVPAAVALPFVLETVRVVRAKLAGRVPLIGFAGAPFTLASYLIEGHGSRTYAHTKSLMYHDPAAWHLLMERLSAAVVDYLREQIAAGAEAVQVFDSWVGCLGPDDYRTFVLPHMRTALGALAGAGVPVIHFGTGTAALLELMGEAGGDVIGLDWRVDLDEAWARVGDGVAVQGNLDPVALLAPPEEIRRRVARILERASGRPGHVFNLGHGVLPQTPIEHVATLVEAVHELSARGS
jgi:uroporphyrinogen decarboxylase